jgi:site-specific DNA-methyltransferase (adenine-specific)
MWLYGSGFPKSMALDKSLEAKLTTGSGNKKDFYKCNGKLEESKGKGYTSMKETNVEQDFRDTNYQSKGQLQLEATTELAKKYKGWGTALKPSFEPIIVARKPFKGSLVDNVIEYGVGGINIDECRVGNEEIKTQGGNKFPNLYGNYNEAVDSFHNGRFPANTILTYDETDFDEVCGGFPNTKGNGNIRHNKNDGKGYNCYSNYGDCDTIGYNDSGSASRYFYCAKASRKDRDEGLDTFNQEKVNDGRNTPIDNAFQRGETLRKNIHPTVKPTSLMQYLVRLVTPKGGTILDPFMGSGSTGKAVMFENKERKADYNFIGIEKEKDYCNIAEARIRWAEEYKEKKENENQISFEDLEAKDEI